MAKKSATAWWISGGTEYCCFCFQTYIYEHRYYCEVCDCVMCPMCMIEWSAEAEARACPECHGEHAPARKQER